MEYNPPISSIYPTYILPSGGLYATYHLLREPETTIDILLYTAASMANSPGWGIILISWADMVRIVTGQFWRILLCPMFGLWASWGFGCYENGPPIVILMYTILKFDIASEKVVGRRSLPFQNNLGVEQFEKKPKVPGNSSATGGTKAFPTKGLWCCSRLASEWNYVATNLHLPNEGNPAKLKETSSSTERMLT